jgi:hypothetical protein
LRAHFDGFNRTCADKLDEANSKAASFDLLHVQVTALIEERDRYLGEKLETERRLSETLSTLAFIEEERRNDQLELNTVKEQMLSFRTEYVQYKAEA